MMCFVKKVCSFVLFLMLTQWVQAQCDTEINNFTLATQNFDCVRKGKITVNAPTVSVAFPAGTQFSVQMDVPNNPIPVLATVKAGESVDFENLAEGMYSFTLYSTNCPSTPHSVVKSIGVADNYANKNFELEMGKIYGGVMTKTSSGAVVPDPTSGYIKFTIKANTGIGVGNQFQVHLEDMSGNVLIAPQTINRTNIGQTLRHTLIPNASESIPAGQSVLLKVRELVSGRPVECRDLQVRTVVVPEAFYAPGTYTPTISLLVMRLQPEPPSPPVLQPNGERSLFVQLRRGNDGKTVLEGADSHNPIVNHFKGVTPSRAKATIQNITKGTPLTDITDSFQGEYYIYNAKIDDGDKLQIVIDDGFGNVVTRTFTVDKINDLTQWGDSRGVSIGPRVTEAFSCVNYLKIELGLGRIDTDITFEEGGTVRLQNRWYEGNGVAFWSKDHWELTRSLTPPTFKYEVWKSSSNTNGNYTISIPEGTGANTFQVENYNLIDVTQSGEGWYKVRISFLDRSGNPITFQERVAKVYYSPSGDPDKRFKDAIKRIESNYGVFEGTVSLSMRVLHSDFIYPNAPGGGVTPTLTIERADGQATMQYPVNLLYGATRTATVTFPQTLPLIPAAWPDGVGQVGLGDFPAGEYIITLADACGSYSETVSFTNKTSFGNRSFHRIERECNAFKLHFNYSVLLPTYTGFVTQMYTVIAEELPTGQFTGVQIRQGVHGTFENLYVGKKYKLYTYNHYYQGSTIRNAWTLLEPYAKIPLSGTRKDVFSTQIINRHRINPLDPKTLVKEGYIDIEEKPRNVVPYISSVTCGANGTGVISVDITENEALGKNIGIIGDITYRLVTVSGTTETPYTETTVPNAQRTHTFKELPDGNYKIYIIDACDSMGRTERVDSSAVLPTASLSALQQDVCKGDEVTMFLALPIPLYDVEWYVVNADGTRGLVATDVQTFTQAIHTNTVYEVRSKLKDFIGCPSSWATVSATATLLNDTMPPVVMSFPADSPVLYPSLGNCTTGYEWDIPTYTDSCTVQVSVNLPVVASSGKHRYDFGVGVHSVVYTFTDAYGNTTTQSFVVTVEEKAIGMSVSEAYLVGLSSSELAIDSEFNYEISYKNTGLVTLTTAVLTVQLPSNANVQPNHSATKPIDFSGSGATIPYTYDAGTKAYTFTIPSAGLPAPGGSDIRKIRIPLKLVGGYAMAQQPCMNQVHIVPTLVYEGGTAGCPLRTQTATVQTPTVMTIKTDDNKRTEVYCVGNPTTLTVAAGFDEYKWYYEGTLVGTNSNSYTPPAYNSDGEYRVEKYKYDCGVATTVSYEIIAYKAPGSTEDPIRKQTTAGVLCANDNRTWTSHFYLCEGESKTITVNFVNATLTWEKLDTAGTSCTPRHATCPVVTDGCWQTVSTHTNTFTVSQGGRYRLKAVGTSCVEVYYFDVFDSATSAGTVTHRDETDYFLGSISVTMATQNINYNYQLTNLTTMSNTSVATKTAQYNFTGLTAGTYLVTVNSTDATCLDYTQTVTIEKKNERTVTATFVEWTDCNKAKIRFEGDGGKPPYYFAVWSVDGEVLAPNGSHLNIPASDWVGSQGEFDSYFEVEMDLTRIGTYRFVMKDDLPGARALSNELDINPTVKEHKVTFNVTHLDCATASPTGAIKLDFEEPSILRVGSLFKLNDDGTRTLIGTQSGTLQFFNLEAGNYAVEYTATVASKTCRFEKRPIAIHPPTNPLLAFAGIVADKTCSTLSPARYTVAINNATGGVPPYRYSFEGNNDAKYQSNPIGYVDGNTTVYVKDNSGCVLALPITVAPIQAPTVSVSTPTYICSGFGIVTVTAVSTVSQTYQYSVNTTTGTTQSEPMFTLGAGTHTIYVHYTPNGITSNRLYEETFGAGEDACGTELNYTDLTNSELTCEKNSALSEGKYAITKQAFANTGWIIPTDANNVTNGRYMVNSVSAAGAVIFKKQIKNVVAGAKLHVSAQFFNLFKNKSPQITVELRKEDNSLHLSGQMGTLVGVVTPTWETKTLAFDGNTVTGTTYFVVIKAGEGVVALDDVKIWQDIQLCDTQVPVPVTIEDKKIQLQWLTATSVSCYGASDGTATFKVHNPPAIGEYSLNGRTWTATTINAANEFTVTGLAATLSGTTTVSRTLYFRDVAALECKVEANYIVTQPDPLSLNVVTPVSPVRCDTGVSSVTFQATGGTATYTFTYQSTTMATAQVVGSQNGGYSDVMPLAAGTYTITVTDAKGCATSTVFEIEKKEPQIKAEITDGLCYDGTGKVVEITVENGNGGYEVNRSGDAGWYTMIGTASISTYQFVGLHSGTHTFTVKDIAGCQTSTSITIYEPLKLTVSQTAVINCGSSANSTFVLTAAGGTPVTRTFTIYTGGDALTVGAVYTTVTTLAPTYTFTTTDRGVTYRFGVHYTNPDSTICEDIFSGVYEIPSLPQFKTTADFKVQSAYCGNDGSINTAVNDVVDINKGIAPYTVKVFADNGSGVPIGSSLTPTTLATGNYIIVLTDGQGCQATKSIAVGQVTPVTVSVTTTPIACGELSTAEIVVSAGGHSSSRFTMVVQNNTGSEVYYNTASTTTYGYFLPTDLPRTITVSGLNYGDYEVVFQDIVGGCQQTIPFTVGLAPNLLITATPTTTGCAAGTGEIIVRSYNINPSVSLNPTGNYVAIYKAGITTDTTDPTMGWVAFPAPLSGLIPGTATPTNYLEHTFTGLIPGATYEFIVLANTGSGTCTFRAKSTIPVPTSSTLSITTTQAPITCSGASDGTVTFTLSNWSTTTTIDWEVYNYPSYTPVSGVGRSGTVNVGASPTVSGVVSNLGVGQYVIVFTEAGNCVNASPPFVIRGAEELKILGASPSKPKAYCTQAGEIEVTSVSGGVGPYSYLAQSVSSTSVITVANFATPNPLEYVAPYGSNKIAVPAGAYQVWVMDAAGCVKSYGTTISIAESIKPTINNVNIQTCGTMVNGRRAVGVTASAEPNLSYFYQLAPRDAVKTPVSDLSNIYLGNLDMGTYTLTLEDSMGCATSTTFVINPPLSIGTPSVVQSSCTTPTTQIVLPNITGGTGTYTWELYQVIDRGEDDFVFRAGGMVHIPSGTATTVTVTLAASQLGEFEFRVSDSETGGCPLVSTPINVEAPKVPKLRAGSLKVIDASCSTLATGSISLEAEPISIAPISFKIISMTDLATGVTTTMSMTPTSSMSNYAEFSGVMGTASGTQYVIEMMASNGCSSTATATVYAPTPIQIGATALTATQFSCSMSAALTASLHFDVSQVTGGKPYTSGRPPYSWDFVDASTGSIIGSDVPMVSLSDVNGGSYYVVVRDNSGGCATQTTSVRIEPAFTLSNVSVAVVASKTCVIDETIAVSVEATPHYIPGTTLSFIIKRLSDNVTIREVFSSTVTATHITHTLTTTLGTGSYEITVENGATSCGRAKGTHSVADISNKYDIAPSNGKQPTCSGDNDGEITLTMIDRKPTIGGDTSTSGFTYTITSASGTFITAGAFAVGSSSITLTGLTEGNYRVVAQSNVNGCSVNSSFNIPASASPITVNAYPTPIPQVNCSDGRGNIMVAISGGQAPYQITLTSSATSTTKIANGNNMLFYMEAGSYAITVTDALGCSTFTGTVSATLLPPTPLTASVTVQDVRCEGEANGTITVSNIRGGSGSNVFVYELEDGVNPKIIQSTNDNVFRGLKGGRYILTITDGMGCSTQTTVDVWEPTKLKATVDLAVSNRLVCFDQTDGRITVRAEGGVQPYAMDIYSQDGRRITPVSYTTAPPADPQVASPTTIVTADILGVGAYYVSIVDAKGCATKTAIFTVEAAPNIAPTSVYQEKTCEGNVFSDAIKVQFKEAIDLRNLTYELQTQSGTITTGTLSGTSDITNTGYIHSYDRNGATQTLTLIYTYTHSDGSQIKQCKETYVVTDIENIAALTVTQVTNTGLNTVEVAAAGGVAPYTYYFNGKEQGANPVYVMKIHDPGRVDPNTQQIIKEVAVQVIDAVGCVRTLTIEEVYYDIVVPNYFTPDGDGVNDTWKPKNIESYPKAVVYIFDRNGRRITILRASESWNGMYGGKHLPSGDYWYILELNTLEDTRKFYGNFTLYR